MRAPMRRTVASCVSIWRRSALDFIQIFRKVFKKSAGTFFVSKNGFGLSQTV